MTTAPARGLHGEIEPRGPARARDGRVTLTGWCAFAGEKTPPAIRLVAGKTILPLTARTRRTDVPELAPGQPAPVDCGFVIEGRLPPGVHLARLEAQGSDGQWILFKTFTLAVEPRPFAAAVETPAAGTVRERVHVEGWAVDPRQPLQQLFLRYGHQEIACVPGRVRTDVPKAYPEAPQAAQAGFKSKVILSAGRGPLRLKARLADDTAAIARTDLRVDIAKDENHDGRIDFGAARIALANPAPASPAPPPAKTSQPLNVLFLLPGSFSSNSALHVSALANELSLAGHACTVAVSHDLETLAHHAAPAFRGCLHAEAEAGVVFANGRGPDVLHAWTTRENVRQVAEKLRARHHARLVVHLEDNEQAILAHALGRTVAEIEALPDAELPRLVPADLSHPRRAREFLAGADAVTVITETLKTFVPAGRPVHVIQPAADARYFYPRPRPDEFRRLLDRRPGETVLFYHGNVHAANAAEVRALYAAVVELNRAGEPVTLIRTGLDRVNFPGDLAATASPHVLALGQVLHHRYLPALMALADMFVQPGEPDAFNDYRFPSKLPEFFALGRPVILPRTNLGTQLRHGRDAWVLDRADAAGIVTAVTALRRDSALQARLAEGAAAFAAKHFSWRRSAEALAKFYAGVTTS